MNENRNIEKDRHEPPTEKIENRTCKPEILPPGKHGESRCLWEEVFPEDCREFLDVYYEKKGRRNQITVFRDGQGSICSMIHWNPVELSFYGHRITADYLVAVATRKDMRRKGLMAALIREGLVRRAEGKMPFVFLTPAKEAYYTPFGFVTVGACFACGVDQRTKDPSGVCEAAGFHFSEHTGMTAGDGKKAGQENLAEQAFENPHVREILPEEYDAISDWINRRLKESYSLYAHRSADYMATLCRELASEGGRIMGIFDGDQTREASLKGVFLYTTEGGPEITEPVCDPEAEDQVYETIRIWSGVLSDSIRGEAKNRENDLDAGHREGALRAASMEPDREGSMVNEMEIVGCSPNRPGVREKFKAMIRIVSLEECIRFMPAREAFTQCIRVTDPILEENNGVFLLSLSPGGNSLKRLQEESGDCVELTIEELAALLFHDIFLNEAV